MSRLFHPDRSPDQIIAKLVAMYQADHAKQRERFDPNTPEGRCPYCKRDWRKICNTKLDGHAKCLVSVEFMAEYAKLVSQNGWLTYQKIGEALGLTVSIARAWFVLDGKRREAERSRAPKSRP